MIQANERVSFRMRDRTVNVEAEDTNGVLHDQDMFRAV